MKVCDQRPAWEGDWIEQDVSAGFWLLDRGRVIIITVRRIFVMIFVVPRKLEVV